MSRFSRRHGYTRPPDRILFREDAPEPLRTGRLEHFERRTKVTPSTVREVICRMLRRRPDPTNWSEYPNIWGEVESLVYGAEWYEVYDFIEEFYKVLVKRRHRLVRKGGDSQSEEFEARVNELFVEEGAGWQLNEGSVESRGDDAFESAIEGAREALKRTTHEVAAEELAEARADLSRRPKPNLSGAMHHAMAALESVTREMAGNRKATLGEIVKRDAELFPKPVDEAVTKLWGFASENARHGRESRQIEWEEAQLVVGTAAVLVTYLLAKHDE